MPAAGPPSGRFRVIILGNDTQLLARPATPVQLARACLELGYDFVAPASWGDELIAHRIVDAVRTGEPGPTIAAHCPNVAKALSASGPPRHAVYSSVAPPVAVARYLRKAFGPRVPHIAFAGLCDASRDESIDSALTPEGLMATLLEHGLPPVDQPNQFDGVLPADRSRYASLGGGAPHPAVLQRLAAASLHDVTLETMATVARACPIGARAVLDPSLACGCVCARDRLALERIEPPRATSPVVNLRVEADLAAPLPVRTPTVAAATMAPRGLNAAGGRPAARSVPGAFDGMVEPSTPGASVAVASTGAYWTTPDVGMPAVRPVPGGGAVVGLPGAGSDPMWATPKDSVGRDGSLVTAHASDHDAGDDVVALNLDIDEEILAAIDRARENHRRQTPPAITPPHGVAASQTASAFAPPSTSTAAAAARHTVSDPTHPGRRRDDPPPRVRSVARPPVAPGGPISSAEPAGLEGELSFLASILGNTAASPSTTASRRPTAAPPSPVAPAPAAAPPVETGTPVEPSPVELTASGELDTAELELGTVEIELADGVDAAVPTSLEGLVSEGVAWEAVDALPQPEAPVAHDAPQQMPAASSESVVTTDFATFAAAPDANEDIELVASFDAVEASAEHAGEAAAQLSEPRSLELHDEEPTIAEPVVVASSDQPEASLDPRRSELETLVDEVLHSVATLDELDLASEEPMTLHVEPLEEERPLPPVASIVRNDESATSASADPKAHVTDVAERMAPSDLAHSATNQPERPAPAVREQAAEELAADARAREQFLPTGHDEAELEVRPRVKAPLLNGVRVTALGIALLLIAAGVTVAVLGVDRVTAMWRSTPTAATGGQGPAPNDSTARATSGSVPRDSAAAASDSSRPAGEGNMGDSARAAGTAGETPAAGASAPRSSTGQPNPAAEARDSLASRAGRGAPPASKIPAGQPANGINSLQAVPNPRTTPARAPATSQTARRDQSAADDSLAPTVFRSNPLTAESDSASARGDGSTVFKGGPPRARQASKLRPLPPKP